MAAHFHTDPTTTGVTPCTTAALAWAIPSVIAMSRRGAGTLERGRGALNASGKDALTARCVR